MKTKEIKKTISSDSLAKFLTGEVDIQKKERELTIMRTEGLCSLLESASVARVGNKPEEFEEPAQAADERLLLVVTPKELGIFISGLVAQKKLMRSKIRNNERHALAGDRPSWTATDFAVAIKKRKVQLADADMLKTRLETIN